VGFDVMAFRMRAAAVLLGSLLVVGCASNKADFSALPSGSAAYAIGPAGLPSNSGADYRIGPFDTLDVTVFEEPDLSVKAIPVDASGQIALPLVGSVSAKGKTASALSHELAGLFNQRYLRNAQVTVTVASSVSQKVSVQGEVTEPGVYPLQGPTTLLGVLSLAKGETEIAALNQVVVFRTINGQRMGAVFDIRAIRSGSANDPQIQGNDMVVVGYSAARRFWQDVVRTAPLFNIFRPITTALP
jgi:polysaccharide export outer membrane protein